jgi:Raf kinase inhibitor-like YbhB/YbcL family protein
VAYDPYELAFPAPSFTLTSTDFEPGGALPRDAYAQGGNESPQLAWTGLPEGTRSLVLTAFDADAPIPGGLWHWVVKDLPAALPGLDHGAAGKLPDGAVHVPNDLGVAGYSGVNPPPGTGTHRLYLCATALSIPTLDVPAGQSLAMLNIALLPHTLARAILIATSTAPAA